MSLRALKLITIFFILASSTLLIKNLWHSRTEVLGRVVGQKLNVDQHHVPTPSSKTAASLKSLAQSKDFIVGIVVTKVDFVLNVQAPTFYYFKEEAVEGNWLEQFGLRSALFGENEQLNQRLVSLINGQFLCLQPNTALLKHSVTENVCLAPVPSNYGNFVGFISVLLNRRLTVPETNQLQRETEAQSQQLYERDVLKLTSN